MIKRGIRYVDGDLSGATGRNFFKILIEYHHAKTWYCPTHGAKPHGMAQSMMITDYHSYFCLTVMIANSTSEMFANPANYLGVERFAATASNSKAAITRIRQFISSSHHHTIGSRC